MNITHNDITHFVQNSLFVLSSFFQPNRNCIDYVNNTLTVFKNHTRLLLISITTVSFLLPTKTNFFFIENSIFYI